MTKYHINPKTMRPNQCTATVRGCAYAKDNMIPEHYDTKEQARAAAEETMAEEYGKTAQVKKPVKPTARKTAPVLGPQQELDLGSYSSDGRKAAQKLGKVAEVEETDDRIVLLNASGESISLSFEPDCCSAVEINNISVKPIDSPLKNIVEGKGRSEGTDHGEVKDTRTWILEYEDGTTQEFEDINYSNGYYGNSVRSFAVFEKEDKDTEEE